MIARKNHFETFAIDVIWLTLCSNRVMVHFCNRSLTIFDWVTETPQTQFDLVQMKWSICYDSEFIEIIKNILFRYIECKTIIDLHFYCFRLNLKKTEENESRKEWYSLSDITPCSVFITHWRATSVWKLQILSVTIILN